MRNPQQSCKKQIKTSQKGQNPTTKIQTNTEQGMYQPLLSYCEHFTVVENYISYADCSFPVAFLPYANIHS